MTAQLKESKSIVWILLPVFLALVVSAIVGLQLFQDGSSYLLEILITHSAIRHERISILLFQSPTILLLKALHRLQIDTLVQLPIMRLAFNFNYALTPFVSLLLSWLVVRKREERLLIWAALIILFVNLINFSWVSELLISVQLTCPLLLALLQDPKSKTFWILAFLITPFIFFLHPLVITLYLVLAAASAFIGYRQPAYKSSARLSMIIFLVAAACRGVYSLFALSPYEVSFLAEEESRAYLLTSSMENVLFLGIAIEIAFFILLSPSIINSKWLITKRLPWLILLQLLALLMFTVRSFFYSHLAFVVLAGCLGVTVLLRFRFPRNSTSNEKMRLLYISLAMMAVVGSSLLLAQFIFYDKPFKLKTGLALFATLLIMIMAVMDRMRIPTPYEDVWRFRLVIAFAVIFAYVIVAKSFMWQASVYKLEQTLRQTEGSCTEVVSTDFQWLENGPYTIIDNWSLSSLALVVQDQQPRKLVLGQNDCQLFFQSGMIQVDPWSRFSKEHLVPPLD